MLNGANLERFALPVHLPSLFVNRAAILENTFEAPLMSIGGRWLTNRGVDTGWDLTGLHVTIKGSGAFRMKTDAPQNPEHPDPDNPDWSSLHWVVDSRRLFANAPVKAPEYTDLNNPAGRVTAMVDLLGGLLQGGDPLNQGGANWVWFMGPGYVQAITDTVDWVAGEDALTIDFRDANGRERGYAVLAPEADCWLINELGIVDQRERATSRKVVEGIDEPSMPDHKAYFDAFRIDPEVENKIKPRVLYAFRPQVAFDTGHCILMLVRT